MKKFLFVAVFGLLAFVGYASNVVPLKNDFSKEIILQKESAAVEFTAEKTQLFYFENKQLFQKDVKFSAEKKFYVLNHLKDLDKQLFLFKKPNDLFKISRENNEIKDYILTLNYKTIWAGYKEYLQKENWRINVKKLTYEQFLHEVYQNT